MPKTSLNAVVIGSGFGGLAAAIRLQAAGISTRILEKRAKLGGRAYVYEEEGFTFDAGPTVITAPHVIDELFALAGKKTSEMVDLLSVSPFYRLCWEDGYRFDYGQDEGELLRQMAERSPKDAQSYLSFYQYTQKVFDAGYRKLVHVPFLSWWDMARAAPKLLKLRAYRSVYSTVSSFIKDERLREALSFHSLLIGGNPFEVSSIYTLIHALERQWGVFSVRGGTHVLVRALGKLFEELGGKIDCNAEVSEICTDGGCVTAVRTQSGEIFGADIVVSNADVTHTYGKLLAHENRTHATYKKLLKKRYSQALFVLYFGTDRKYEQLAHHSILFGGDYKKTLECIFKKKRLPERNSFYLHAPCRTDSSLAPEGKEAFYLLANVPNLSAPISWKKEGEAYADKMISYLERHYMPDLSKHIVCRRYITPITFRDELNAHWGTAFSLEPTLLQSAYFRVHNRDPDIQGLYFVGAGTHPGAGIPGVINSAKATVTVISKDFQNDWGKEPITEWSLGRA